MWEKRLASMWAGRLAFELAFYFVFFFGTLEAEWSVGTRPVPMWVSRLDGRW
jgi:hypothetical protein